jgi:hypothetical protein
MCFYIHTSDGDTGVANRKGQPDASERRRPGVG